MCCRPRRDNTQTLRRNWEVLEGPGKRLLQIEGVQRKARGFSYSEGDENFCETKCSLFRGRGVGR